MAITHESTTTGVSFALTDEQRDLQALELVAVYLERKIREALP